jgi:hypothetical protein
VVVTGAGRPRRARSGIRFASADVSGGGAFLRSDYLLEIGELLTLEFDLPGGHHVSARGRVVRTAGGRPRNGSASSGHDPHAGIGVEFIDLSPEDRAAIEERL